MANNAVSPSRIINYISQRKKLIVGRNNQPNQQLIKFDYKLTDTYNFQVINQINQIVAIPSGTTFELYGSFIDGKQQQHLLFYTSGVTADEDDVLTFVVDSYTSEYLNQVKVQKEIDLSIVATDEQGNKSMTLRDKAIAYPRPYIEGRVPTQIVQEIIYVYNQPVTGSFSAGSDINLAPDVDSFAFGEGLYTDTQNQLVIGSWNVPSSTTNQAFVIGNGDNDSNRSNAFSVDWDGNVQAGAISATEIYINGLPVGADTDAKIEVLSAAIDDISASVPLKVSDLENDAGYITSSDIPSDYVTNTQLDEAISSFITIEDVPVYTADNKTLQLNGTEFSIKSLESKISGGVGINVTTTDDVTWITYIGGSSTGGKTYLNGTGLGLSTVSAEDGIYKLYVNEEWLEGKIEAQTSGSFDDISNSIDNISLTVNSNYETLTGQTNYLSGQIDASNEAIGAVGDRVQTIENDYTTSAIVTGWINDLETGAVKTNSDSIEYLSGQISANTASIDELTNAVGSKADLSDFQELTGTVDSINTNLTSNYYTKTEIDTATGAIDERLTAIENDYTTSAQVSDIVTSYNYITSSDIPTQVSVFENDALYVTSSQLTGELNAYTKTTDLNDYLSSGILTSYVTDQQLEEKQYATTGIVDAASSAILDTLTSDYALKTDIPTDDEITGLAKDYVDTLNIDTTYATKSEIDDFATSSEVGTIIGDTVTSGYIHDLGFITNSEVQPGTVYSTGFGLAASGDAFNTFYLTGTVLSGSEHISIENNVVSLIGEVGKTYSGTANGGIEVDNVNNTITISANYLSSNALDSYGDKTWVETNFLSTSYSTTIEGNSQAIEDIQGVTGTFALKADIPADIDDFATSAEVSGIVEGLSTTIRTGLALESDIPTTVAELTDAGDYALKSELIDTEDVSGVVEDMSGAIINGLAKDEDIPTDDEITGLAKDYVDTLNLATTYALKTDVPTGLDDWDDNTNKEYISGLGFITLQQVPGSVYSTSFGLAASGDSNNIFYLTAGVADLSGYDTLALKSDLPTKVSDLTNDSNFISAITLTALSGTTQVETIQTSAISLASTDFLSFNDEIYIREDVWAKKTDIPTSGYITGLASAYVDSLDLAGTYASATEFNSVCTALSDAIGLKANSNDVYTKTETDTTFATKAQVAISAISGDILSTTSGNITGYAYDVTTATVTSSYITGLGIAATDTTYSDGNLIAITGDTNTINFTGTIPTKISDLTNDSEFATTGYVTGYCSSFITIEDVPTKVSQLQNDVTYLPSSGLSSVYGLLNGENINISQAVDGTITLSAGTGGGGTTYTEGDGIDISEQDVISIDQDWLNNHFSPTISNKKNIIVDSEVKNSSFQLVYNANKDIFVNTIESIDGVITINQVSGFTGDNGQVASFEHWIKADGTLTGFVGDGVELVNVPSSGLDATKTQVFTRRIVKVNDVVSQYAVWEYQFSNTAVPTTDKIIAVTPQEFIFNLRNNVTSSVAYTFTGENQQSVGFTYSGSLPAGISFSNGTFSNTGSQMAGNGTATVPVTISALNAQNETITKLVYCNLTLTGFELVEVPNQSLDFTYNTNATSSVAFNYYGNQAATTGVVLTGSYSLPAGVSFNNGTFTCVGANLTGNTTTPLTAVISGADVESITTEFNVEVSGVPIVASNQTFNFDFRLQDQTSALAYTHLGSATVNVSNANLPNGISYANGYFTATSAANVANGTTVATTTISADDADSAVISTTFNLIGHVTETITAPASAFTFDFANVSDITSTYVFTYTGNMANLSTTVTGLPEGITSSYAVDGHSGIITLSGNKDIGQDKTFNVNIKLEADDAVVTTATVSIEVQNSYVDPLAVPLTFTALQDNVSVQLSGSGAPPTVTLQYSKNGGSWTNYNINGLNGQLINLNNGDTLAFSGNNSTMSNSWQNYRMFAINGAVDASGNIMSLLNFSNTITDNCLIYLFNNRARGLKSSPYIPYAPTASMCYNSMFRNTSLTSITVGFTEWGSSNGTLGWVEGVPAQGEFHCPAALDTTTRDMSHVPSGWTVINDVN